MDSNFLIRRVAERGQKREKSVPPHARPYLSYTIYGYRSHLLPPYPIPIKIGIGHGLMGLNGQETHSLAMSIRGQLCCGWSGDFF
jgi:hypothetical protein